jgi:predicted CopG family antitoxin
MADEKNIHITIDIDDDVYNILVKMAEEQKKTLNDLIIEALKYELEKTRSDNK